MQKDTTSRGPAGLTARFRRRKGSNEVSQEVDKSVGGSLLVNDTSKYKSMLIRAYSTLWMIGGFAFIIYMGHLYIWAMVVVIQIFMAKELFILLRKSREDSHLPGFWLLNWHFFFTAMLFVYGRILSQRLVNTVTTDKVLYKLVGKFIKYHMVTCYVLYTTGFVWFILALKKKMYKYQFGQYAWTHMILIVVFTQSSFTVANIFEGIFWFLLPASLIVINDIAPYIFGFFFGRTPLIKLSPKKTWEGFIGASVATMISAFLLANILGQFQWLTCLRKVISSAYPTPIFRKFSCLFCGNLNVIIATIPCRIYQLAGFIVILVHCSNQTILLYQSGFLDGGTLTKVVNCGRSGRNRASAVQHYGAPTGEVWCGSCGFTPVRLLRALLGRNSIIRVLIIYFTFFLLKNLKLHIEDEVREDDLVFEGDDLTWDASRACGAGEPAYYTRRQIRSKTTTSTPSSLRGKEPMVVDDESGDEDEGEEEIYKSSSDDGDDIEDQCFDDEDDE